LDLHVVSLLLLVNVREWLDLFIFVCAILITLLLSHQNVLVFKLTIIYVAVHHKAFFAQTIYLVDRVVTTLAILVHNVLAEAIIPGLTLISNYLIHLEATLNVTISV
jgi:hypothetical protein